MQLWFIFNLLQISALATALSFLYSALSIYRALPVCIFFLFYCYSSFYSWFCLLYKCKRYLLSSPLSPYISHHLFSKPVLLVVFFFLVCLLSSSSSSPLLTREFLFYSYSHLFLLIIPFYHHYSAFLHPSTYTAAKITCPVNNHITGERRLTTSGAALNHGIICWTL